MTCLPTAEKKPHLFRRPHPQTCYSRDPHAPYETARGSANPLRLIRYRYRRTSRIPASLPSLRVYFLFLLNFFPNFPLYITRTTNSGIFLQNISFCRKSAGKRIILAMLYCPALHRLVSRISHCCYVACAVYASVKGCNIISLVLIVTMLW